MNLLRWLIAIGIFGTLAQAGVPHEMPLDVETPYAEALVAYYSGNYKLTLKSLDKIEASGVDKIKILELRALALQYDGQYQEAVEVYRLLLQEAADQNVPPLELVLFDYQTGILMMQKRRYLEARLHLERSLQKGINRAYTAYLLGIAAYRLGDDRAAGLYLRAARDKASEITKPAAAYYLGLSLARQHNRSEAITLWKEAKESEERIAAASDTTPTLRETMRQLGAAIDASLDEETASRFTGEVGVVTSYDTNPVIMPQVDAVLYGQGTVSQMLRYSLGLHTSPSRSLDITPMLAGFTNFNTNPDTSIAQYVVQHGGLVFTLSPGTNTRFGLRFDGRFMGRYNRLDKTLDTEGFDGGAEFFIRDQGDRKFEWGIDLEGRYLDFQTDPQFNTRIAMSGVQGQLGTHWHFRTRHMGWNPGLDTNIYYLNTDGDEWRNFGSELILSDAIYFTEDLVWLLRLAAAGSYYPDRRSGIFESPIRVGWDFTYRWHDHLRFGTQLNYVNSSAPPVTSYAYQRFVFSVSMDYFF